MSALPERWGLVNALRYRITVNRPVEIATADRLAAIPGVRVDGRFPGTIEASRSGAALAAEVATSRGYSVVSIREPSWKPPRRPVGWRPEIRDWVWAFLLPHQRAAIAAAVDQPGWYIEHPGGAGKTLAAVVTAFLYPGPVVFVVRGSARGQFAKQIERFTEARVFTCKPKAEVRKRDRWKTLDEYLTDPAVIRPTVVVGWESLTEWAERLADMGLVTVIFDEIHRARSSKRVRAVSTPDAPDDVTFVANDNRATAAFRLSRTAARRFATSATPIENVAKDLWAQYDLIRPGEFGPYRLFAERYCDRKPGAFGGFDDKGASHGGELARRLDLLRHKVDSAITHATLPPRRRESIYLSPAEQDKPGPGFASEIKAAAKRGSSAILECRLAEAATRKRSWILDRLVEGCEAGHKCVVFTGRRRDVDTLAAATLKKIGVQVWGAHGDYSPEAREAIRNAYMEHPGPCILIGTGESFGESLDLQDTDVAIFAMLPYTTGQLRQWEWRFTRLGQKRPVIVYYVIAEGTVDERVVTIIVDKLPAVEAVTPDSEVDGLRVIVGGVVEDKNKLAELILSKLETDEESFDDT